MKAYRASALAEVEASRASAAESDAWLQLYRNKAVFAGATAATVRDQSDAMAADYRRIGDPGWDPDPDDDDKAYTEAAWCNWRATMPRTMDADAACSDATGASAKLKDALYAARGADGKARTAEDTAESARAGAVHTEAAAAYAAAVHAFNPAGRRPPAGRRGRAHRRGQMTRQGAPRTPAGSRSRAARAQ